MSIKEKIIEFMEQAGYKPMERGQIAKKFNIDKAQNKEFFKILAEMEDEGTIVRDKKNLYGTPEKMNVIVGTLQGHRRGYGFLLPDNKEVEDVFISSDDLNGALHGDRLIVSVNLKSPDSKKQEGEVIRILEHANETLVGLYESSKNFAFVIPVDTRINKDIFVAKSDSNGAQNGQVVEIKIKKWAEKNHNPEGVVTEVIGFKNEPGVDIKSIIMQYGLPEEFPEEVLTQAEKISETITPEELEGRMDFRNTTTFTIDGADAKDYDDAISIEKLENGNYKLGVHIADVTHYVREGTPLDKEALDRGTSVYLVDRVIPMLPEKLSNGVCSLRPNEDRLTLSVMMEIDSRGKVVDHSTHESVISSKERLIYTDVSDILECEDEDLIKKYQHIVKDLKNMEQLAKILKDQRNRRGSIDFDFPESRVVLDEKGHPTDIVRVERRVADGIIEEFMLITNETVSEYMHWSDIPFLYRIHEDPDPEKIEIFNKFIHNLGYSIKGIQDIHPKDLQKLIKKIEGKPEEKVISTLMLRSLKKARYSAEIDSHFGLASEHYSHFTAPIRRYPDLQIHRIIKEFINGKITDKEIKKLKKRLPEVAEISSRMERRADEAERETEDLKKVEYMKDKIGEEYDGIISGVLPSGFFVELENTVEGMVRISSITDDYYEFNEPIYGFVGERTKKIYKLGDMVRIRVAGISIAARQIEFELAKPKQEEA